MLASMEAPAPVIVAMMAMPTVVAPVVVAPVVVLSPPGVTIARPVGVVYAVTPEFPAILAALAPIVVAVLAVVLVAVLEGLSIYSRYPKGYG